MKCSNCEEDTAISCANCEKPICYDCAKNSRDNEPICLECKRKEVTDNGECN